MIRNCKSLFACAREIVSGTKLRVEILIYIYRHRKSGVLENFRGFLLGTRERHPRRGERTLMKGMLEGEGRDKFQSSGGMKESVGEFLNSQGKMFFEKERVRATGLMCERNGRMTWLNVTLVNINRKMSFNYCLYTYSFINWNWILNFNCKIINKKMTSRGRGENADFHSR